MISDITVFNSSTLGVGETAAQILLGNGTDREVLICTEYEIECGIFEQPGRFSVTLGNGDIAANLIKRYPKGSPFQILVGGQPQFTGYTDGFDAKDNGKATEVIFEGRCVMAAFCDDEIAKDESFTSQTHRALLELAIKEVNLLRPFEADPPRIFSSNAVNRAQQTGTNISALNDASEAELLQIAGSTGDQYQVLRTHLEEKRINLIRRHLDAAGLFMWSAASGDLVVGVPNINQPPLYRLVRERGVDRAALRQHGSETSNVVGARFKDTNKPRFSEVVIYGKQTGHKVARTTTHGAFIDEELASIGFHKVRVKRDTNVTSIAHAEHLAKKELAAHRRAGFVFEYTIGGHTAPSLLTGGQTRAVFAPDTIVEIVDEEFGINGPMWIEHVTHRRKPFTETTIRMLRPETLIFGDMPTSSRRES